MKLDTYKSRVDVQPRSVKSIAYASCPLNWSTKIEYEASTWVQLLELPSPYSFGEALLLCQHSEDEWIAWIPDHGEAVLHTSQFCISR